MDKSGGARPDQIWEFGHLLWRPLGYFLWQLTQPLTATFFRGNPVLEVESVLFGLNFLGGAVLSVVVFAITRRLGLTKLLALAVSLSILLSSAVLQYVHSGTSYVPGLALHMLGIWWILKALQQTERRVLWAALAGVALGLACDIWFLYILGLPAAWLAEYLFPAKNLTSRERVRLVAITIGVDGFGRFGGLPDRIGAVPHRLRFGAACLDCEQQPRNACGPALDSVPDRHQPYLSLPRRRRVGVEAVGVPRSVCAQSLVDAGQFGHLENRAGISDAGRRDMVCGTNAYRTRRACAAPDGSHTHLRIRLPVRHEFARTLFAAICRASSRRFVSF